MRMGSIAAYAGLCAATMSGALAAGEVAMNHLRVVNHCAAPVWIQEDNLPGATPIVKLAKG